MLVFNILLTALFAVMFIYTSRLKVELPEGKSRLMLPFFRLSAFLLECFPVRNVEEIRKKQALLNPARGGHCATQDYFRGKLSEALLLVLAGNLLCLVITARSAGEAGEGEAGSLVRNEFGGGEQKVELHVNVGDGELEEDMDLTVAERRFTGEELTGLISGAESELERMVLGENDSYDHVDLNLNFTESLEGYPFSISYTTSDHHILDTDGRIGEDFRNEDGEVIMITARLEYMDFESDHEFYCRVFPLRRTDYERLYSALMESLVKADEEGASEKSLELPDYVEGRKVEYSYKASSAGTVILALAFVLSVLMYYARDSDLSRKVEEREKQMMLSYPEIVSKLSLLLGAGMTTRAAFEKIASDYRAREGKEVLYAYEEMLVTMREMQGGVSEYQAYLNYGERCHLRRFAKLSTLLSQNLRKGGAGMLKELDMDVHDAFEDRKAMARKLGEEAGTKLLLPMGMMLVVVMIIVIVPAFMSFSF